jgi:regulatory protein
LLLARRDYTSAELSTRLTDRGYAAEDVADALKNLVADGSVNDARVAAAHVRTSTRIKGRGRLRVKGELLARGISRQAIDEALSAFETGDEREALLRILKRKRYPERPTLPERQRMYQHLLRRGFPGDLIRSVLGRGNRDQDESDS